MTAKQLPTDEEADAMIASWGTEPHASSTASAILPEVAAGLKAKGMPSWLVAILKPFILGVIAEYGQFAKDKLDEILGRFTAWMPTK